MNLRLKILLAVLVIVAVGSIVYLHYRSDSSTTSASDSSEDPQLVAAKSFNASHPSQPVIFYIDPNRATKPGEKIIGLFGDNFASENTILINGDPVAQSSDEGDMPKTDCFYPDSCIADSMLIFTLPKSVQATSFSISIRNSFGTSNAYQYVAQVP